MKSYDLLNAAAGWAECRVSGALLAAFLNGCANRGLRPVSAEPDGDFALRVRLRSGDVKKAERIARKTQCALEVISAGGAPRFGRTVLRRASVAAGLLLIALLLVWSKLYIWEIEVTGNETVPTARILDGLRECGIGYGSFWPSITSDILRSELLIELPELSWATVNIHGSRAEVIVRERVPKPEIWSDRDKADVVAAKPGFVTGVRVLNGTAKVRQGSAVLTGETLISAETDSAFSGPRTVHAAGTVLAETYYELTALAPLTQAEKVYTGERHSRWAVVVGKNRYNFYGNSSISTAACDRITTVWDCAVGGVFSLPVSVIRETELEYGTVETERDGFLACRELEAALHARLLSELGPEAEIESERFSASAANGVITVTLRAKCTEDIGIEVPVGQ